MIAHLLLHLLAVSTVFGKLYDQATHLSMLDWDFVVVGGGAAGAVVANRLTENPAVNVLLLEAGPSTLGVLNISIPWFVWALAPDTPWDWNFTSIPQVGLNNRTNNIYRGFGLGGSTAINGMFYTRGSADDYNRWADVTGDEGWSWDALQPYFHKNERWSEPADHHNPVGQYDPAYHSTTGVNSVSVANWPHHIDSRVIQTTKDLPEQFPFNLDYNSGNPLGISWLQLTVGNGTRSTSATSYLGPSYISRPNLHVVLNTRVTRILPTNGSFSFKTVEYASNANAPRLTATASKEVILSAGSIGSPHILLHSGIGDENALKDLGIVPLHHIPSVGKNLTDHAVTFLSWFVNSNLTAETISRNYTHEQELIQIWNETHSDYLSGLDINQVAWVRLPNDTSILKSETDPAAGPNTPHISIVIDNGVFDLNPPATGHYFTLSPTLVTPTSRGEVTINSTNPFDPPLINPGYLTTDFDIAALREGVRLSVTLTTAPAWDGYILERSGLFTNVSLDSDEEVDELVRNTAGTDQHSVSTNKMSKADAQYGVVNPDLKVKGIEGLRIVDASVFPYIPSANTQAATYVLAERAADLIKSDWA